MKQFISGKTTLFILVCSLAFWTVCSVSCSSEATLMGISASPPVFLGCRTEAEGEVHFIFSRDVKVASMYFEPSMETEVLGQGQTVTVRFDDAQLPGGSKVTADILVEDSRRNTLNVLVSFYTRNNHMPSLVINEIRTAYNRPRVEFIEIKTLSAGNLGAMRLFAAYTGNEPIYIFPPIEVNRGEYIVVHTRSIEPGLVDETGTILNLSRGTDASPNGRDLWMPGSTKLHETNAIYLMDQDDTILDGVLIASSNTRWRDSITAAAEEMVRQGIWPGSEPGDAFNSEGNTATRTINRIENRTNSHSPADWYITVTSGATPGRFNNPNRYVR